MYVNNLKLTHQMKISNQPSSREINQIREMKWLISTKLLAKRELLILTTLRVLSLFSEIFGLALLLPLIKFIEAGEDVAKLQSQTAYWQQINTAFEALGMQMTLGSLSLSVLTAIISRQILLYLSSIYVASTTEKVTTKLRLLFVDSVLSAKPDYFGSIGSGRFASMGVEQAMLATQVIQLSVSRGATYSLIVLMSIGALLLSPWTAFIVISFGASLAYSLSPFYSRAKKISMLGVKDRENLSQHLSELYGNWRLYKLLIARSIKQSKLTALIDKVRSSRLKSSNQAALLQFIAMTACSIFIVGSVYISNSIFHIGLAEITLFLVLFGRAYPLILDHLRVSNSLARSGAATERLREEISNAEHYRESTGTVKFTSLGEGVSVKEVTVIYKGRSVPALYKFSLDIIPGEITMIVGKSGSGKSTLVDLLTRYVSPLEGEILIDGTKIEDYCLTSLRASIAYLPQRPSIFEGSIFENLVCENSEVSVQEIEEVCRNMGLHSFFSDLPNAYNYRVSEGGVELSGGQRQRLVLARIFLMKAELIILDEPTSALDPASEDQVMSQLCDLVKKKNIAVIIITHSVRNQAWASRVVTL
jgi:ABC-type multidrug transport system fused ATPase/permease subunit